MVGVGFAGNIWQWDGDFQPCLGWKYTLIKKILIKYLENPGEWLVFLTETLCLALGEQSLSSCARIPFHTVVSQLCQRQQMMLHGLTRPCPTGMELGEWADRGSSSQNGLELLILVAGVWNTESLCLWRKRRGHHVKQALVPSELVPEAAMHFLDLIFFFICAQII